MSEATTSALAEATPSQPPLQSRTPRYEGRDTGDLVIVTKAGLSRSGPDDRRPPGRPEYLRQQAELSPRHLGVERIDLFQLHRIDPEVPLPEQLGEPVLLQQEGKIRHIGLSEVAVEQINQARETADIVSVQNLYDIANRSAEDVLDHTERENPAFIPWFPMATGELARPAVRWTARPSSPARTRHSSRSPGCCAAPR